jgi:adenylate cyclase
LADDWLSERRAELQSALLRCLGSILAAYARLERHDAVEQVASRILELDPLDEEAHRALMTVYLRRGQRSLAFRQLQRCRKSLLRDLSVTPQPETVALIRFPVRGQIACADVVRQPAAVPVGVSNPSDKAKDILLSVSDGRDRVRARAPSLVVMPFDVLGQGARADLLAYGLVDDLVVDLSRFSSLFVVPPGPATAMDLHPPDPVRVGSTLEVRYVLTGSVQEIDDRVRVAAMLLDSENGRVLWADRYDRQLTDLFEVRDDLARHIAVAAASSAEAADYDRLRQDQRDTSDFAAWELCTLAQRKFLAYVPEHNAEARSLFGRALALDPGFTRAQVGLAWTHAEDYCFRWSSNAQRSLEEATELAFRAAALGPRSYRVRYLLSYIHHFHRQREKAVEECARARADNPNDPDLIFHEGYMMTCSGRAESGFNQAEEALCLNPCHPDWFHHIYGVIALEAGRYETSRAAFTRYMDLNRGPFVGLKASALRSRVAANELCGRPDAARQDARHYLAVDRNFRVSAFVQAMACQNPASIDRMTSALRSAGLPA